MDERRNNFEIDEHNVPWLDLGFNGSTYNFFNRLSIFGGAAVTLEVLNRMDHQARIAGSKLGFAGGEIVANGQLPQSYRYILCHGNKISYLCPNDRSETKWAMPHGAVEWIYVDRSAGVTDELVSEIRNFLSMSQHTRLAFYVPREMTEADKSLAQIANIVFADEDISDIKTGASICFISDQEISLSGHKQPWRIERTDLMTHLTVHSIIAATVFGTLIAGKSIKEALLYAKVNAEGSSLSGTLPLPRIKTIAEKQENETIDISLIAASMVAPTKGILAIDESCETIGRKFEAASIPNDDNHRNDFRKILIETPELERYVNAVILNDKAFCEKCNDGRDFVSYLTAHGVIPGVRVDEGLATFPDSTETYTKGIEGLKKRLPGYYEQGLRFCKWRSTFEVDLGKPSEMAVSKNCQQMAEYAKACQDNNLVPIVEPELLYDGNYTLEQSAEFTGKILDALFDECSKAGVKLDSLIVKTNMVLAGKKYPIQSTPEEVGRKTAEVLKSHIPENVAGVVFLSGGQNVEQATANLAAIHKNGPFPWPLTFSFARALTQPALEAWKGENSNVATAQGALKDRLIANTEAVK